MQHTTTNRHSGTRDSVAGALLLAAGIAVLIASADALAVMIAAVVIVTLVWAAIREIEHRVRNRAELAPVTHLRPTLASHRDLKTTSSHASWRGPTAA